MLKRLRSFEKCTRVVTILFLWELNYELLFWLPTKLCVGYGAIDGPVWAFRAGNVVLAMTINSYLRASSCQKGNPLDSVGVLQQSAKSNRTACSRQRDSCSLSRSLSTRAWGLLIARQSNELLANKLLEILKSTVGQIFVPNSATFQRQVRKFLFTPLHFLHIFLPRPSHYVSNCLNFLILSQSMDTV